MVTSPASLEIDYRSEDRREPVLIVSPKVHPRSTWSENTNRVEAKMQYLKGSKTRSGAVSVDVCSRDGGFRVKGMACRARAVEPVTESGVLGSRGAVALPRMPVSDVWSGSPVVLVDDAAEDIATNDGAADRRNRAGDRLGE